MFRIVMAAVILTLCMIVGAATAAFLLLVYSRMRDDIEALAQENEEYEQKNKKLEAEVFALRLRGLKEQGAERADKSAERRAQSADR